MAERSGGGLTLAPAAPIYLDHHATTPVDARVLERMLPYFREHFGNASSPHSYGWRADEAVEVARGEVAALLGAQKSEVVFTSGATEANNLAILGAVRAAQGTAGGATQEGAPGNSRGTTHLITQATEHPSVLAVCRALQAEGARLTVLPVDRHGLVSPDDLEAALTPSTALVSVMFVNNEVGAVQPIAALGAHCKKAGVLFHCDATQAAGVLPIDVEALGVDLLSLSAHKIYGPKGVGALYVRRKDPRVSLAPVIFGGDHERARRPGTLNVPGIVGMGEAVRWVRAEREEEVVRLSHLRARLWDRLSALPGVTLNGPPMGPSRHPGNLHVSFAGVDGEELLLALRPLAVATGAACATGSRKPSHVLLAMCVPAALARGSLRIGLGRGTTPFEIDEAAERISAAVTRLGAGTPRQPGENG